jgi:hypothetical protein
VSARIVLLDLVMTLVENTHDRSKHWHRGQPYTEWIDREEYRMWLVELLRGETVILMTARPERYRAATLQRLQAVTSWLPAEAYFNELGLSPPEAKRRVLTNHVYPRHGRPAQTGYLALESNAATRAMYHAEGIAAIAVPTTTPWTALPEGG